MVFLLVGWLCILIRMVVTQVCTHRVYLQRPHAQVLVKAGGTR